MDESKLKSLENSFIAEAKWLLSRKIKIERENRQNILGIKRIRGALRAKNKRSSKWLKTDICLNGAEFLAAVHNFTEKECSHLIKFICENTVFEKVSRVLSKKV